MPGWPKVDPVLRRQLLRKLREDRHKLRASLTPTQRLEWLEELRALTHACRDTRPVQKSGRDEPPELWLRLKRHWREVGSKDA